MPRKMNCSDSLVCRPICFFIVISFLMLCGPCILTSFWIKEVGGIKDKVNNVIYHKTLKGIMSEINNIDTLIVPLFASSNLLVKSLGVQIGQSNISLPIIQQKVAPTLYQTLLKIPHLSQISYIGFDGSSLSYFTKGNQHFVLYSNSSSSNSIWYTRSINEELGTPYGEPVVASPSNVFNTSWFQDACTRTNTSTSIGHGWSNNEDLLFLNTVCINGKGAISLGFPIHFLADYLSSVIHYNGSLYFDIENGTTLIEGIPNTHLNFSHNSVSFMLVNEKGDKLARVGDVTCKPDGDKLNLWGTKYVISCSQLKIFGVKLEYVLVVPNESFESLIKNESGFAYALLILIIICMIIFILSFVISIVSAAKRELSLCATLVKQKEATRQAERKSMNKSLAFARASHDVRTSLAGINGLIEMSREYVPQTSELGGNLLQMEECTKDLLGILNSILDTSKIEAGKMQLKEEDFNVQKLVEDVVDFHYNIGIKKGVDIILDLTDGSLPKYSCIRGDRGKLKQILDNLLSNAIKFTHEGHVMVKVWAKKPCFEGEILESNWNIMINRCIPCSSIQNVLRDCQFMRIGQSNSKCIEFVFEVSDTGIGIPKDRQQFVFENYVQVNEAKSGQEGTGLGLGIVQSLVRLIGGEIGIMDKQEGEKGTCFRFNVYFSSEPKEYVDNEIGSFYGSTLSELQPIPKVPASSQIILFIQNEERERIIKHFLEIEGIKVFAIKDLRQFCTRLERIRGGKSPLHYHSSPGMFDLRSPASQNSKSKDIPLSAMDGKTECATTSPSSFIYQKKSPSSFILFLIDTSSSPLHEIHEVVKEFRGEIGIMHSSRVVWIKKFGTRSIEVDDLDDSTDVIVSKPLHGSRLNQILKLLPEYGGVMQHSIMHDLKSSKVNEISRGLQLGACNGQDSQRPKLGKRVLVAEDNLVQQMITKQALLKLGFEVDLCENGATAVELVSNGLSDGRNQGDASKLPYDYIFMDCKMEKMDGFEASRHIREMEKEYGVYTPIIALTAHVVEDVIQLIKEAGMDHYLSKPLKREQLLKAIEFLNQ